jgi:hypothetical protein
VVNAALGTGSFLGRPPDPTRYNNWRDFAVALSAFMADQSKVSEGVQPEAIQLIHIDTTGQLARVVTDGLMVYDPVRRGVMVSINGEWLPLYAGIAYGGMRSGAAAVAGADITTAWQKVTAFSEALPTFDMTFDFANDTFTYERPGLYQMNVTISIEHNNSGVSRELDARITDTITGLSTRGVRVPTGATDRTTTFTQAVQTLVPDAVLGHPFILEVAAPLGQYTAVQYRGVSIQAARLNYAF